MEALTEKQRAILDAIVEFHQTHHKPPTIRELGERFGISWPSVLDHIKALERKGYLQRTPSQARNLHVKGFTARLEGVAEVPLIGRVAAGLPVTAVENREGSIPIPQSYARSARVFALRVRGDSMIDEGILDGDIAIVREQPMAQAGDIVVAMVGEGEAAEATIKRYQPRKGSVELIPANRTMKPIVIKGRELASLKIVGKVIGSMRWFER